MLGLFVQMQQRRRLGQLINFYYDRRAELEDILISQDICTNKDDARIAIIPAIVAERTKRDMIDPPPGSD